MYQLGRVAPAAFFATVVCAVAAPSVAQRNAQPDDTDLEERYDALYDEFRAAEGARMDAMRAAENDVDFQKAAAADPWSPLAERFEAIAFEAEGTEIAAKAWTKVFVNDHRYAQGQKAWDAFGILVYDHVDSRELKDALAIVHQVGAGNEDAVAGLQFVIENSGRAANRGASHFSLAKLLEQNEATREQAFEHYRTVAADYADVDGSRGQTLGEQAEAALFESQNLQIGMQVPNVSAIDETGASFQLSDYEGKVMLLDFWGFW